MGERQIERMKNKSNIKQQQQQQQKSQQDAILSTHKKKAEKFGLR